MSQQTTALAGQALADALTAVLVHGEQAPETFAAAQVATVMTDTALRQGATADDIRRAAGLPT
jgi:hypothetical protein